MKILTKVITDYRDILPLERDMNRDLNLSSENPFLYSRLITEFMRYCPNFGCTPLIFTFWADDELVGLVPLKLRTRHTLNHVSNLFDALYSDFFLSIKTRELCITQMIDFLFKRLNCSSISLTLSNPSTLDLIKNICLTKKIHFITSPFMGSSIIPIETDWKSFYDSLNAKVRKEFQRRKKALSHLGPLKTVSSKITSESIKKIHSVEQTSWKHNWRKQHGITEDSTLNPILRASKPDEKTNPIYASEVWFLESAGQPIAYTLVLLYKETAFLVKTSYNSEFKKFGPGNLLTTEILHNLFQRKSVTKIDFVTNLRGDKIWKPVYKNRIRITLNRNLLLSKLLRSISRNFASVGRLMKKPVYTLHIKQLLTFELKSESEPS